ncbi:transcriptional regulator with XRE-family HTH domain [Lachnospiraceae bacterium PF1-22]|uniref:helix-turn-helix domain-containing protein n=1 Tax=Ohessyouella blattaphilus TaxID=2949333 RepID=UPI003E2A8A6F
MEFNEKLQKLRKQKNWTQEELAEVLFVSRTAISKWESGRGYPSIESLKEISKLFSVSVDDLLSSEELITLAESEQKSKASNMRSLILGLLDCLSALLFFLPLFGQEQSEKIVTVPLIFFADSAAYIRNIFIILIALMTVLGILQLALQNWQNQLWLKIKLPLSFGLSVGGLLFAIASRHPYPGTFLLCLFVIKVILVVKKP